MSPPEGPGAPRGGARPGARPRARSAQTDPRSIITPDAFNVSEALLGTPLASPGRRLAAILLDLVIIGAVTVVTKSFAMLLGVVAALYFMRAGFKRVPVEGSVFGRAMRFSVGCLGLFIGFVTFVVWASVGLDLALDRPEIPDGDLSGVGAEGAPVPLGLRTTIMDAAGGFAFGGADNEAEAEAAAVSVVEVGREIGLSPAEIRQVLEDLVPEDAEWTGRADEVIERALRSGVTAAEPADELPPSEIGPGPGGAEEPASAAAEAEPAPPTGALPSTTPATDSIARLLARIEALDATVASNRADLAATERALEDATEGGIVEWIRNVADVLGFGFGWATLYMTAILPWWSGRTVGKRLVGIRVVRLDGQPITWWTAFERAGGYAAGFATGLLGFAQVYWDANRQAIHDRIVGTVVVRDGVDKVIDWESAL